jgi:putative membrane protein
VKPLLRGALALGLVTIVVLLARESAHSIAVLLDRAGWRLLLLVPLHTVPLLLDVIGWRVLIFDRTRIRSLFWIASIREAINRLLPVANVGGEFVGIRLLSREGISSAAATSSVVVEMLLNLVAQYLFFDLGLALLLRITRSVHGAAALLIALAGPLPILALFFWLLRSGALFRTLEKIGARMLGPKPLGSSRNLDQLDIAVRRLVSAHGRLALGTLWQLAGLITGCSETWLALRWLGHPVSLPAALALESFTLAARSLIFFAPAGLGVQEAGLIGVGYLLGLGGDVAMALSLAKRMREILFGLPALAAWQLITHRSNFSKISRYPRSD